MYNAIHDVFDTRRFIRFLQYAVNATDVIARRLRLAFQDVDAAKQALYRVVEIMGEELKWTEDQKQHQIEDAFHFIDRQMGHKAVRSHAPSVVRDRVRMSLQRFQEQESSPGQGLNTKRVASLVNELNLGEYTTDEITTVLEHLHSNHGNKGITEIEFLQLTAELRQIQDKAADAEKKAHWPYQKGSK